MNFEKNVFPDELAELARRRALETDADTNAETNPSKVSPDDLVGLCFSGGGIRSSTYNLGIVRGLHRWGVLKTVDYLSTVSGGGYIGSHVSDLFRQGKQDTLLNPKDAPAVARLRQLGRFLTPKGSLGEWLQGLVGLLRGLLWNCSIFALLAVALAASFAFALDANGQWIFPFPHGLATIAAVGVSVIVLMLSVLSPRLPPAGLLVTLLVGTVLVATMDSLPGILHRVAMREQLLEGMTAGSVLVAVAGSGALSKLPAALYALVARLVALLLVVVLPLSLFLLMLLYFINEADTPTLIAQQLGAIALLGVFLVVDFNRTSLHGFYRDRIGATFLASDETKDRPPKLSDFAGHPGPLHLINVALNVPADDDLHLRDRLADFFTLSCLHVGSPRTGYTETRTFEAAHPDFTAASAVAISGAAASPNMGTFTDALIRPIMTLLNVRMGYWAPNPSALGEERPKWRWVPRLPSLFREMVGNLRSDTALINISDGGHLENFGAFELLRRKCRLIIIGDGGADPDVSLGEMAILIRYAYTDLGADIDIDLDDIRRTESGYSTKHAALGTVRYKDGTIGRILYLKSSVTGLEPPDVRYYRDAHPDFPYESTADQWFDDAQFDAYRRLGEEVIDSLFKHLGYATPAAAGITDKASLRERLAALSVVLAPCSRSRADSLTQQLNDIESALMRPEVDAYRRQLIPTIHRGPEIADKDLNTYVSLVVMQLQLMENAVTELGLVDVRNREALANRGWMNVFQRWAQSDVFRKLTLVCLPSFGANLTQFVDVALNLSTKFVWAPFPPKPNTLALLEETPKGESMIAGLANHDGKLAAPVVNRLVMRGGLGGRDRVEAAIAALRVAYPAVSFTGDAEAVAGHLPADAYINRAHDPTWTADDEAEVLGFTSKLSTSEPKPQPSDEQPDDESDEPQPQRGAFAGMLSFGVPKRKKKAPKDEDDKPDEPESV